MSSTPMNMPDWIINILRLAFFNKNAEGIAKLNQAWFKRVEQEKQPKK